MQQVGGASTFHLAQRLYDGVVQMLLLRCTVSAAEADCRFLWFAAGEKADGEAMVPVRGGTMGETVLMSKAPGLSMARGGEGMVVCCKAWVDSV
jgi:chloramphenicol 3-O-phosphotransferase